MNDWVSTFLTKDNLELNPQLFSMTTQHDQIRRKAFPKISLKSFLSSMFIMGQSRPLFVYFRPFLIPNINNTNWTKRGLLGIRTRGRRMVGTDETTELRCPLSYCQCYTTYSIFVGNVENDLNIGKFNNLPILDHLFAFETPLLCIIFVTGLIFSQKMFHNFVQSLLLKVCSYPIWTAKLFERQSLHKR